MEPTPETIAALKKALLKRESRHINASVLSEIPYYAVHDENMIAGFFGDYRWLSNFWIVPSGIKYMGTVFPSVEHAYQAAKCPKSEHSYMASVTAGQVKKLGKKASLPHNWDSMKYQLMEALVSEKFNTDMVLRGKLFDTEYKHLEERNSWGDVYWGTNEQGVGQNNLGKILMMIRAKI